MILNTKIIVIKQLLCHNQFPAVALVLVTEWQEEPSVNTTMKPYFSKHFSIQFVTKCAK